MKKIIFLYLSAAMILLNQSVFSQAKEDTTAMIGLAGDNLDLYAVLTLFQKSKTIEAFEKSLNDEQTKINNLDLNLDKKVDFIKVVTKKDGDAYTFVLQVDVTKTETQDVAVIYLNKDKDKKISLQMVGDPDLYGKDYVIEPKGNSSVTPNPAYTGADPVTVTVPASTTTVVVEQVPIVQYVYSPAYVPYVPPYYYGYYPPYFAFATCIAVGIYRSNNYYYHGGYYGGHYGGGNTVIINNGNRNQINHYNNSRNRSNTVNNNMARGDYGNGNRGGGAGVNDNMANRGSGNRGGAGVSDNMANKGSGNRGSGAGVSDNMSNKGSGNRGSSSTRPSTSNTSRSSSYSGGGGRSMGGGGRSMGGGGGRRR